jgi:signal peptidase I
MFMLGGEDAIEPISSYREDSNVTKNKKSGGKSGKTVLLSISVVLAVAALALVLSYFVFPVITVSGDSNPHYQNGDVVLLMKPMSGKRGQLCAIRYQNKLILRRVIACGGDTVDMDTNGNVFRNGAMLDEPYVTAKALGQCDITFPYVVPEGKVFVLRDDRTNTSDSRSQMVGCIDEDEILGQVVLRIWPWT